MANGDGQILRRQQHANHTPHAGAHPIQMDDGVLSVQGVNEQSHVGGILRKLIAHGVF